MTRPGTLGELKASGWVSRPVKEEVRANALARIAEGRPLVDGVIGYEDTVLPQLENALIAGHDVIFLGERGQAKTRMIRSLTELLDEWMPIVAGSEINDDPYAPDLAARTRARRRARRRGADRVGAPRAALRREAGDARHVDRRPHRRGRPDQGRRGPLPLRRAHHPLRPRAAHQPRRSSRSTSSPTSPSASRSACSTCSRSATCRSAATRSGCRSTSCCVASANPEDYTNRGRIITPLKDRFGAQIRTHYPLDAELEAAVVEQEARPLAADGLNVQVPGVHDRDRRRDEPAGPPLAAHQPALRACRCGCRSPTTRRSSPTPRAGALRHGETEVVPRVSDLDALVASTAGKVEFETVDDGREEQVLDRIVKASVLETFRARTRPEKLTDVVHGVRRRAGGAHRRGHRVVGVRQAARRPARAARHARRPRGGRDARPGVASAVEFVLEGLHLSKRLNKDAVGGRAAYRGRG